MPKIVSVHSFRGGTGKSNLTANLSWTIATRGYRVGVIDTDIQSPGIHVLFKIDPSTFTRSLNDYLWGNCAIEETAIDINLAKTAPGGALYLIPSSLKTGEIARILDEGYDVALLNDGFRTLIEKLKLDYLFIDTHPGVNEETLLSIAISDSLLLILRPDQQDFQGTAVTVALARELEVPDMGLILNKVLPQADGDALQVKAERIFGAPVVQQFPLNPEMAQLGSDGVFAALYPDHDYTRGVARLADRITSQSQVLAKAEPTEHV